MLEELRQLETRIQNPTKNGSAEERKRKQGMRGEGNKVGTGWQV